MVLSRARPRISRRRCSAPSPNLLSRSPECNRPPKIDVLPDHSIGRGEIHAIRASRRRSIPLPVSAITVIQDIPLLGIEVSYGAYQDAIGEDISPSLSRHQRAGTGYFAVALTRPHYQIKCDALAADHYRSFPRSIKIVLRQSDWRCQKKREQDHPETSEGQFDVLRKQYV